MSGRVVEPIHALFLQYKFCLTSACVPNPLYSHLLYGGRLSCARRDPYLEPPFLLLLTPFPLPMLLSLPLPLPLPLPLLLGLQVLSRQFLRDYGRDIINIHHGLLPSFKGANPYRQVRCPNPSSLIFSAPKVHGSADPPSALHSCAVLCDAMAVFYAVGCSVRLVGGKTDHLPHA